MFCPWPGWILDPCVTLILKQFLFFNLEVYKPCLLFLMNVKKYTKIALGKILKFEIAITRAKVVQMSSSFAYMASLSVRSRKIPKKKYIWQFGYFLNGQNQNFDQLPFLPFKK